MKKFKSFIRPCLEALLQRPVSIHTAPHTDQLPILFQQQMTPIQSIQILVTHLCIWIPTIVFLLPAMITHILIIHLKTRKYSTAEGAGGTKIWFTYSGRGFLYFMMKIANLIKIIFLKNIFYFQRTFLGLERFIGRRGGRLIMVWPLHCYWPSVTCTV